MTSFRDLPELVQDSELEVTVDDAFTIHTSPLGCRDDLSPQRWATIRTLGRGGDGTVFLQQKIEGPGETTMLAVKQMSLDADLASEDHNSKRYVRELEALAKFAQGKYSRSFVRTYGWYQDRGWLYICMEYCQHLDLGKYLRVHGTLSEEHAKVIAGQVLHGLLQMHKNHIAHRDLKPANILIHRKPPENDAWWVVLGDLGLSRRNGASSGTTTIRGTPSYMAPETIGKPFLGDPKNADPFSADMWCLGETIARALTGRSTFTDDDQLLEYQSRRIDFPDGHLLRSMASIDALNFVRSLMEVDPKQRPTAAQALNHSWIKASLAPQLAAINSVHESKTRSKIVIRNADGEIIDFNDPKFSKPDQATQASAQWTQTTPIHSYDDRVPLVAYNVANVLSQQDLLGQRSPGTTVGLTKETSTSNKALMSIPSSKRDSSLNQVEHELLESFKAFSAAEKLRMSNKQNNIGRNDKEAQLNDFKKFSQNLRLRTPIPIDILPFLSNDEEKQRRLEASAKQEALIHELEDRKQDDKTLKIPPEDSFFRPKYTPASWRQLYGDAALPPSINANSRPPPPALRPPLMPASSSAVPRGRWQPQPQVKAVSEIQRPVNKVVQPYGAKRWEDAVRLQELNAQSLFQPAKVEERDPGTGDTSGASRTGKKNKKKNKRE